MTDEPARPEVAVGDIVRFERWGGQFTKGVPYRAVVEQVNDRWVWARTRPASPQVFKSQRVRLPRDAHHTGATTEWKVVHRRQPNSTAGDRPSPA